MSREEKDALVRLALGHILRISSRPAQRGDVEEYERCRAIVLDLTDSSTHPVTSTWTPNYARDRFRGAAGD